MHPIQGPGQVSLRKGRVTTPGQVYLVTAVVQDRTPVFAAWQMASAACRIASGDFSGSRFVAWVLMPDHFHGLLLVGEHMTLSETMRGFKGRVAKRANELLGRAGALWQHGFHDHALRREEHLEAMARYIIENPVRAGLVARVGDYPYWNTDWAPLYDL